MSLANVQLERSISRRAALNLPLLIGSIGTAAFVLSAVVAPWLAPFDPQTMAPASRFAAASASHLLGTDEYGRDTLSRLLYGGRISLVVALLAVGIGLGGGTIVGMIAGYRKGPVDNLLMRAMDLLFSFPAILLAIVMMAVLGSSITNAMVAIGIIFIPGFARLCRSLTRSVMLEQYVAYARATGVPVARILIRDVLPNIAAGLLVQATVAIGYAVTLEATLSFLGLGAQPPVPSWGNMVDEGRGFMARAPLMVIAPAVAILVSVLSANLLGEGLQLGLDRKQARGRV